MQCLKHGSHNFSHNVLSKKKKTFHTLLIFFPLKFHLSSKLTSFIKIHINHTRIIFFPSYNQFLLTTTIFSFSLNIKITTTKLMNIDVFQILLWKNVFT